MRTRLLRSLCAALLVVGASAKAGDLSYELDTKYSFVGSSSTDFGSFTRGKTGDIVEQNALFRFVVTPQINETVVLRLGTELERYSFGLPSSAPVPNTLQSAALILGVDLQAFNSWLIRIEASPGFYSDFQELEARDFDCPLIMGGSYIVSPDLQWIVGFQFDVYNRYYILPGVGVRWKFAEKWVCNAILPNPRLEYSYSKNLLLYADFDYKNGSYHVDEQFGTSHNMPTLNGAVLDYSEVRVGGGISWKVANGLTFDMEAGYMPYRSFKFHRTNVDVTSDSGAPYGQVSLGGRF